MNFMLCTGEHTGQNQLYSFRVSVTGGLMAPVRHMKLFFKSKLWHGQDKCTSWLKIKHEFTPQLMVFPDSPYFGLLETCFGFVVLLFAAIVHHAMC